MSGHFKVCPICKIQTEAGLIPTHEEAVKGVDAKHLEAAAEAHYNAVWQGRRVPVPWADADDDIRSRHRDAAAAVLIAAGVLQRSVRVACPVCGGVPGSTLFCPSCEQANEAAGVQPEGS
jgi:hypothetical protein